MHSSKSPIPIILLLLASTSVFYSAYHINTHRKPSSIYDNLIFGNTARAKVISDDPELFKKVSMAMLRADPIRINFGYNLDEYDPEAGTVIPRLKECENASHVTTILHEEFIAWFDPDIAGPREKYEDLAKLIWKIWNNRQTE